MVYVLGCGGDVALGLDGFAEGRDFHLGEDVEGEEVAIVALLAVVYVEGDAPVGSSSVSDDIIRTGWRKKVPSYIAKLGVRV